MAFSSFGSVLGRCVASIFERPFTTNHTACSTVKTGAFSKSGERFVLVVGFGEVEFVSWVFVFRFEFGFEFELEFGSKGLVVVSVVVINGADDEVVVVWGGAVGFRLKCLTMSAHISCAGLPNSPRCS
jgi:hypothetical protein